MNTQEFIDYWDSLISKWVASGTIPDSEEIWREHFGEEIKTEIMPEPYWGNPDKSSIVVLNYNPATDSTVKVYDQSHYKNKGYKSMSKKMSPKYSSYASKFPILDENPDCPFACAGGRTWWLKRNEWFKRLIPESNNKPFALELCAWHSPKWKYISEGKVGKKVLEYISVHIIPVYKEAIKNSDLKIGLSIGKGIGDILINEGFEDVSEKFKSRLKEKYEGLNQNRTYRVLKSLDGIFAINTFAKGSNLPPSKNFNDFEIELIKLIKK